MEHEVMIGYNAQKEMEAILSWLMSWKESERRHFLQTLRALVRPEIDDLAIWQLRHVVFKTYSERCRTIVRE